MQNVMRGGGVSRPEGAECNEGRGCKQDQRVQNVMRGGGVADQRVQNVMRGGGVSRPEGAECNEGRGCKQARGCRM